MMKRIYLLLALVITVNAYGLPDYGLWCDGQLMLEDGKSVTGKISYDVKYEVVRLKMKNTVYAYSAEKLAYFEMQDPIKKIHRKFVSLEAPVHPGYSRKTFFEIISFGALDFLRKSEYIRRPRTTEDLRAPHIYLNAVCKHNYFIFDPKEGLLEIDNFREEVLPLMKEFAYEVSQYINRCNLRLVKVHEQVRVINLYNQLYATNNKLADNKEAKANINFR